MPSLIRLLTIGDCNTSGTGRYSVPSELISRLKAAGFDCHLTNAGAAMYTSREGLAKAKGQPTPSDVILLSFGLVDAWVTSVPGIYISYFPDSRLKRHARKLLKTFKKMLRNPLLRRFFGAGPVVDILEFETNIRQIARTARARNPDIKLVFWGAAPVEDQPRGRRLIEYDQVLRKVALENNGLYLNTRRLLASQPREQMFDDPVHLSKKACELIAETLIPLIQQQLKHHR